MNYAVNGGAFDQKRNETRHDILVYSSDPLKEGVEVSGSIEATFYVGSDAKDTDFTLKIIDVHPDGTAYGTLSSRVNGTITIGTNADVFINGDFIEIGGALSLGNNSEIAFIDKVQFENTVTIGTSSGNNIQFLDNLLKSCLSLKKTILKQAFEGKLVPQDPNDEPAEILLQKMKAEKEQLIQKTKRKSKNVK